MPTRAPLHRSANHSLKQKQARQDNDRYRLTADERGYDKQWRKVRAVKLQNDPLCEHCAKNNKITIATMVHHVMTINERPDLRLVLDNLESICAPCHAAIHRDMKHEPTKRTEAHPEYLKASISPLTIVCGAPCSGKSTYVNEHKQSNDLIIDLDIIASTMARTSLHGWNRNQWLDAALAERNSLLRGLSVNRYNHVWFIVSEASQERRDWWQHHLAAVDLVVMDTSLDECLRRLDGSDRPPTSANAIRQWFEKN